MAATSRVVAGFFIDRLDQRIVGALLLAAKAFALFAMLKFASPHVAFLASAVFGFAVGVMITLPALIIQRECSPAAFGMLSGLTLAIIQTGNSFGPSLLGWLQDATGGYTAPIVVCMAIEIVAIANDLAACRPSESRRTIAKNGAAAGALVRNWPDAEVPRCPLSRRCQAYSGHKRAFRTGWAKCSCWRRKKRPRGYRCLLGRWLSARLSRHTHDRA
jgi:MFS family permease